MKCWTCSQAIKGYFYADLNTEGNTVVYCDECYHKVVLDNVEEPVKTCECGTKNPIGSGHSIWCKMFKKEFK